MPKPGRPRRTTVAATAAVLIFVLCVSVLATGLFVQLELRPIDGRFGQPQALLFPLCGRSYLLGNGDHWTRTQIDEGMSPGYEPDILEPSFGQIPLLDLFRRCPEHPIPGGHGMATAVEVWLKVGPDDYVGYGLEGGP
jgi:hypothetical protein